MDSDPPPTRFPTTRWHRVLQAGAGDASDVRDAIAELCAAYWFPVYAFIRRKGHDRDAAADLTQGFFARLIERGRVGSADPARGRFRTFLLADCQHFLADDRDRRNALKRGVGRAVLSIEATDAEGRLLHEPIDATTPERLFARAWAETLLARVLDQLRREYRAAGRGPTFEALKGALADGLRESSSADLAASLGTTAGALRKALHSLRRRYRTILHEQIRATVDDGDPSAVEDELRALFEAVRA
jgi:RNA polymerase sigma-70 factor (ECF subfamily)